MDTALLVMFPLEAGRKLVQKLEKSGFEVQAAFWNYNVSLDEWRLMIASPYVESSGTLKAYQKVNALLPEVTSEVNSLVNQIYMENVTVVKPSNDLIRALRETIRVDASDEPVWLHRTYRGDQYIDQAYIYLMN